VNLLHPLRLRKFASPSRCPELILSCSIPPSGIAVITPLAADTGASPTPVTIIDTARGGTITLLSVAISAPALGTISTLPDGSAFPSNGFPSTIPSANADDGGTGPPQFNVTGVAVGVTLGVLAAFIIGFFVIRRVRRKSRERNLEPWNETGSRPNPDAKYKRGTDPSFMGQGHLAIGASPSVHATSSQTQNQMESPVSALPIRDRKSPLPPSLVPVSEISSSPYSMIGQSASRSRASVTQPSSSQHDLRMSQTNARSPIVMSPSTVVHQDSGIRGLPPHLVEVPPKYTAN
jgi:hypothetical protein